MFIVLTYIYFDLDLSIKMTWLKQISTIYCVITPNVIIIFNSHITIHMYQYKHIHKKYITLLIPHNKFRLYYNFRKVSTQKKY